LTPREPPVELYHGTAQRNVSTILAEGLRPMKRRHVHLLGDTETALNGVWLVAHVPPQHLRVAPAS
jgi:putative RNA 2'-phosphotransferase